MKIHILKQSNKMSITSYINTNDDNNTLKHNSPKVRIFFFACFELYTYLVLKAISYHFYSYFVKLPEGLF